MRLLTPGPVMISEDARKALSMQVVSHRSSDYRKLHKHAVEGLRRVLGLEDWSILLVPGSGTTAVDSMAWSIAPGKRVLALVWGEFGRRLADTLRRAGAIVDVLEAPPGSVIDPETAAERAKDYDMVALVHNETGTGVRYPWIEELAEALDGQALIVDSVSAAGAEETPMHDNIAAYATCTHKALAAPPGLGIVALNPKWLGLLEKRRAEPPPSIDLAKYIKFAEKDETPFTPPVNVVAALGAAVDLVNEIGVDKYRRMHEARASILYTSPGLEFLPDRLETRSRTVVAVKTPGKAIDVKKALMDRGIMVATGMGELKNDIVRIGVMGYIRDEWIQEAARVIREVLSS